MPIPSQQCGKKMVKMEKLEEFYDDFVSAAMLYHNKRHEFEATPLFAEEAPHAELEKLLVEISRYQKRHTH
jgi:hypothetical protein